MRAILLGGGIALLISLLGTRVAIDWLSKRGYGQEIRDDGPTTHHTKRGTPTMGGIVIILATLVGYFSANLLTGGGVSASALLLLFLFTGMGLVGFLDDFIKIVRQRNLGLRSAAKMIGQTVIALVFGIFALSPMLEDANGRTPASHRISFLKDFGWELPTVLVLVVIWLLVVGFSNAVNLTDGLDGLATGASMMVFGAYTLVNIWQNNQSCAELPSVNCYEVRDPLDLAIVSASIMGAWLAILTRTEGLLIILGGLFVVETLSVILQVGFFKLSKGRRIFRIAPIHHHFEMVGWEEVTVVIRFWIITGLCVATGLGVFYAQWVASA